MRRALAEYSVGGIKTTLPFFREVMRDPEFLAGRLDTGFIPRFKERRAAASVSNADEQHEAEETERRDIALVAAALAYAESEQRGSAQQVQAPPSRWKIAGRVALHQSRI